MGELYCNIGTDLLMKNNPEKLNDAINFLEKGIPFLKECIKNPDKFHLLNLKISLQNLGLCYTRKENNKKADYYFKEAELLENLIEQK